MSNKSYLNFKECRAFITLFSFLTIVLLITTQGNSSVEDMRAHLKSLKERLAKEKLSSKEENEEPVNNINPQQLTPLEKEINAALEKLYAKAELQNKNSHENYIPRAEIKESLESYRPKNVSMMYSEEWLSPGSYLSAYAMPYTAEYINSNFLFDLKFLNGYRPSWSVVIGWVGSDTRRILALETLVYKKFDPKDLQDKFLKILQMNLNELKVGSDPFSRNENKAEEIIIKFSGLETVFTAEEIKLIKDLQEILMYNQDQIKKIYSENGPYISDLDESSIKSIKRIHNTDNILKLVIDDIEDAHNSWIVYAQTMIKLYSMIYESEPEILKMRYFSFLVERIAFLKIYHRYYSQKGTEARCLVGAPAGLSGIYDCSIPYSY